MNRLFQKVTCTGCTCGPLELNSSITTVFTHERDVTTCLFQRDGNKEGRAGSVTEETRNSKNVSYVSLSKQAIHLFDKVGTVIGAQHVSSLSYMSAIICSY